MTGFLIDVPQGRRAGWSRDPSKAGKTYVKPYPRGVAAYASQQPGGGGVWAVTRNGLLLAEPRVTRDLDTAMRRAEQAAEGVT